MGHMNVRFHIARALEGMAGLARLLALPHAFRPGAISTLRLREMHVRFLREAHAGAPLAMTGAVTRWGACDADLCLVLWHADGAPASTFRLRVDHGAPDERVFPWPTRTRTAAETLTREAPALAAPRSLGFGAPPPVTASLARAQALDLLVIGRGVIGPAGCDVHGALRADEFMGRVSDGATRLMRPVRDAAATAAPGVRVGGAVVEYRLLMLDRAGAGDAFELRSGLAEVGERVSRVAHWCLEPGGGRVWVSSEAVVVCFDLDARRILPLAPEARAALAERVVLGLGL
jgi:acyl-CoA thioester hydrolase